MPADGVQGRVHTGACTAGEARPNLSPSPRAVLRGTKGGVELCVQDLFIDSYKKDINSHILFACVCKAVAKLEGQETGKKRRKLFYLKIFFTYYLLTVNFTLLKSIQFHEFRQMYTSVSPPQSRY